MTQDYSTNTAYGEQMHHLIADARVSIDKTSTESPNRINMKSLIEQQSAQSPPGGKLHKSTRGSKQKQSSSMLKYGSNNGNQLKMTGINIIEGNSISNL